VAAWEHASDDVKELADQLRMFPDWRLSYHESALRQILSLADVLVLENVFWLSHAAELVAVVDPWVFPGENENATIGVKSFNNKLSIKRSMQTEICLCLPLKVF